ncbi:MAG: response regulator [Deltaproteobacteria bacterium]|jgi:signal transduction histidine kinase/CheY-like chemotaxis protein|nr:response regulator [Deltaproteobacteria bacterium]
MGKYITDPIAKILFNYLRDLLRRPMQAKLNVDELPEGFRDLGLGLQYLAECIMEAKAFANALSRGDLNFKLPPSDNPIAGPLKALYASLKHLSWQTREIAQGDYAQRVDFMGDFSEAFNSMVEQLEQRSADLVQAKVTAEAALESKSAFLATVSHEMRTPLNAILGLSTMELQEDLSLRTCANLEKIYNAGSHLLNIVNDILDLSKMEAGGFEIIPEEYNFPDLINELLQINFVRIESKDIAFKLEIDETIPLKMLGDTLRVKQILSNLLSNAFKYTDKGQVVFRVSWRREDDAAVLSFSVSDTGMGIKKEDIGKLFTEYSQINSRANRRVEGTGLGLSIAKHLTDLMNGVITVESEYGAGSVFRVDLPQKIISGLPVGFEIADSLKNFRFMGKSVALNKNFTRAYMPYGKILLVDDVETNISVAKGLMRPYGLQVDHALSGQEAVDKIRSVSADDSENKYDAIFMDHMMPDMDGMEATRIIREKICTEYAQTVPIIALTANAATGDEKMFLANGFNAFMTKPIDLTQLDAALNKYVRDKQNGEILIQAEKERLREARADVFATGDDLYGFSVPGLDMAAGIRRYGSGEAYLQMLRSYTLHTWDLLERLRNTTESSLADYALAAQDLKKSCGGVNADTLEELAEKQAKAAAAGDIATVQANHWTLLEVAGNLLIALDGLLQTSAAEAGAGAIKKHAPVPDRQLRKKMLEAAKQDNIP